MFRHNPALPFSQSMREFVYETTELFSSLLETHGDNIEDINAELEQYATTDVERRGIVRKVAIQLTVEEDAPHMTASVSTGKIRALYELNTDTRWDRWAPLRPFGTSRQIAGVMPLSLATLDAMSPQEVFYWLGRIAIYIIDDLSEELGLDKEEIPLVTEEVWRKHRHRKKRRGSKPNVARALMRERAKRRKRHPREKSPPTEEQRRRAAVKKTLRTRWAKYGKHVRRRLQKRRQREYDMRVATMLIEGAHAIPERPERLVPGLTLWANLAFFGLLPSQEMIEDLDTNKGRKLLYEFLTMPHYITVNVDPQELCRGRPSRHTDVFRTVLWHELTHLFDPKLSQPFDWLPGEDYRQAVEAAEQGEADRYYLWPSEQDAFMNQIAATLIEVTFDRLDEIGYDEQQILTRIANGIRKPIKFMREMAELLPHDSETLIDIMSVWKNASRRKITLHGKQATVPGTLWRRFIRTLQLHFENFR